MVGGRTRMGKETASGRIAGRRSAGRRNVIHWSRFLAGTGTNGQPLVPVPATNRDQWMEAHTSRFVSGTGTNRSRRTGTSAPRGPTGALGARIGTYAPMGPGS